jgi:hypothetical protein
LIYVVVTAIRNASIPLPFDIPTKWPPGEFLKLPANQDKLQKFNGDRSFNETDVDFRTAPSSANQG